MERNNYLIENICIAFELLCITMFDVCIFCYLHPILSLITLHNISSTCGAPDKINICIGYHMSGEVISVLSLEGRYYNCHERAQRARDNYNIVTRVIQLISPSQSCDNLFITYLCLYQALNMENTEMRSGCVLH